MSWMTKIVRGSLGCLLAVGCMAPVGSDVGASEEELFRSGSFPVSAPLPVRIDNEPPNGVPQVRISEREANALSVEWRDAATNDTRNELYRRAPAGSWVLIATFGSADQLLYSWSTPLRDEGLAADTASCYRVIAYNAYGSRPGPELCAFTRAAPALSQDVWRVQVRIRTADVDGAGTDDTVAVRLNSPVLASYVPAGNETQLDYGRDDFERGSDFTYDLLLNEIGELHDITMLTLDKPGDDDWCVEEITLLVNETDVLGQTPGVFHRYFGDTAATCLHIGGSAPSRFTMFHDELRAHALWLAGPQRTIPYPRIPQSELESRIESIVGDLIADLPSAEWGHLHGRAVEVERWQRQILRVDLDLEGIAPSILPNPEVDVDFDLRFSVGADGMVSISTTNLQTDVDFVWWAEVLSLVLPCAPIASIAEDEGIPDCISALEDHIEERIQASWTPISIGLDAGSPCADGYALDVYADEYADIILECVEVEDPRPSISDLPIRSF